MHSVMYKMDSIKIKIFPFLLIGLFGSLSAQNFRVTLGARAAALGESAIAMPSGPLSIYYNPASLGFLQQGGLLADYSNLFSTELYEGVVMAATPLDLPDPENKQIGLGMMVNFEGLNDSEIRFGRYIISMAAGVPIFSKTSIGTNFKFVLVESNQKGIQQESVNGNANGLDLSIHQRIPFREKNFVKQIDLGVAVYDIYGTKIEYDAKLFQDSQALFERSFNAGAAIHFRDLLRGSTFSLGDPTLFLSVDDRFHIGSEVTFFNILALRGGYARDLGEPRESLLTFGFGLDLDDTPANISFDYAYMHPSGILPDRHQFTLTVPMFKGPPKVAITTAEIAPIFASYYLANADSLISRRNSIQVENLTTVPMSGAIDIVEAPYGIGLHPSGRKQVNIKPGEKLTLPLPLYLTSEILAVRGLSQPVHAKLRFEYTTPNSGKRRHADKTITMLVHGKNYLVWDELAREAAFITPNDESVQEFKNNMGEHSFFDDWNFYQPIYRAAQFYEALIENGVSYRRDTILKFDSLYTQLGFDNVKYPGEMLQNDASSRRGDCDDLVALYCSLLESDNISTAIVGTSDHLLMLFDTGIDISKQAFLPLPENVQLHFYNSGDPGLDKTIWIPVEVTSIGQSKAQAASFDEAVRQGAAYIRKAQKQDSLFFEIVSTSLALAKFPSPEQPVEKTRQQRFQDSPARTQKALAGLNKLRREYEHNKREQALLSNESGFAAGLQMAMLATYHEDYAIADSILASLNRKFGDRYEILNNRGNLTFLQDDYEKALDYYTRSLTQKPDFLQGYLNRILLRYARLQAEPESAEELQQEMRRDGSTVQRLYGALPESRELSLARLQGILFFEESGRGRLASPDTTKVDSVRATADKPRLNEQNIVQKIRNFFRSLSEQLSPVDPKKHIKYAAISRGKPEPVRLVELLYWSAPATPILAAGE